MPAVTGDYRSPAGTWEPIRKSVLKDFTLSCAAFRLMAYLVTKPPGWVISEKQLIYATGWSSNMVRASLRELRKRHLITQAVVRGPGGVFERRVSTLRRDLVIETAGGNHDAGNLNAGPTREDEGEPQVGTTMRDYLQQAAPGAGKTTRNREDCSYSEDGVSSEDGVKDKPAVGRADHVQAALWPSAVQPPASPPAPGFDAFYAVYPRHVGRKAAEAAHAKAVKGGADPRQIIAGAERYRDDPNRLPEFTKHPATWLNKGCWDDEPLPPRRQSYAEQRQHNGAVVAQLRRREQGNDEPTDFLKTMAARAGASPGRKEIR